MKIKYLVPNFFTACSFVVAVFAFKSILQQDYITSGWLIAVSLICDGLDGKLARLLDASSTFGRIFDTISDFFAFGIVPAVLAYISVLHKFKIAGMIIVMVYVFCGAYRLTRFMRKTAGTKEKKPFTGLPIPAAAGLIASFIVYNYRLGGDVRSPVLFAIIILFSAFLMISQIQYLPVDLKFYKLNSKIIFLVIVLISGLVLFILYPHFVFFLTILIYVIYGIILNFRPLK
jgi:CDP-diacylglycerol---serine O-phosphatidyltransferase